MMPYLKIDHVDKSFDARRAPRPKVLKDVSLTVEKGRVCFDHRPFRLRQDDVAQHRGRPHDGRPSGGVLLEGREVNEPGPDRAVVFQNHSLLPWLTVYDNVRLAVDKVHRAPRSRAPSATPGRCTTSISCR